MTKVSQFFINKELLISVTTWGGRGLGGREERKKEGGREYGNITPTFEGKKLR